MEQDMRRNIRRNIREAGICNGLTLFVKYIASEGPGTEYEGVSPEPPTRVAQKRRNRHQHAQSPQPRDQNDH